MHFWNDKVGGEYTDKELSLCKSCLVNTYLLAYSYDITCMKCGNNTKRVEIVLSLHSFY